MAKRGGTLWENFSEALLKQLGKLGVVFLIEWGRMREWQ
jgi:hypothetical protein